MSLWLNDEFVRFFVSDEELSAVGKKVWEAYNALLSGPGDGAEMRGWIDLPVNYDKKELTRIKAAAKKIQADSEVLVVIGIGGSYLGAAAVCELLDSSKCKVIFAGTSLSARELERIKAEVADKDFSVNIISKSGTTLEPALAFRIFRQLLEKKYGAKKAGERVYATTDAKGGALRKLVEAEGWESFVVPDDIGGRYSVLTAVGLLPIAVAGIKVDELLNGAAEAREVFLGNSINPACHYAVLRNILYKKGYFTEILASYEPSFRLMGEWWKQLFGESEGKDGEGIWPSSVIYTTDLHSLGQFVQDGKRGLFETVVKIGGDSKLTVPDGDGADELGYLVGRRVDEVNETALMATCQAHAAGGVPNIVLEMPALNAYEIGNFIYFMEFASAVSAYTLGVNPFNQPGVEVYKKEMFKRLGKPEN